MAMTPYAPRREFTFIASNTRSNVPNQDSIHDDVVAQKHGFRSAPVPASIVYEPLCRLSYAQWGLDWVRRGFLEVRFLKPVFDADQLTAIIEADGMADIARVHVKNDVGSICAEGQAGLGGEAQLNMGAYDVLPLPKVPAELGAECTGPLLLGSEQMTTSPTAATESVMRFQPLWEQYADPTVLSPVLFQSLSIRDMLQSLHFASPAIIVSTRTSHQGPATPGETLASAGSVVRNYESKGNLCIDTDQLVTAGGRPVAWVQRTTIYRRRGQS
jgi:acyl dehydratase